MNAETETFIWAALLFALLWHLLNTLILLKNRKDFRRFSYPESNNSNQGVRISVLIPARNEETNIQNLLNSLAAQSVNPFEIIVCDDHSSDATAAMVLNEQKSLPHLRLITSSEKPDGWMGKNWACHQLSQAAKGTHLLFTDADVQFMPALISEAEKHLKGTVHGLLTVWPNQVVPTLAERAALTTMYFTLFSLLPSSYLHKKPFWMPSALYLKYRSRFAAACGQFMLFTREAYRAAGGHEAVARSIVDDVELSKRVLEAGYSVEMFNGTGSVACRMYDSHAALFAGFRKNFFAGFNYNWPGFIAMALIHAIAWFLPLAGLFSSSPEILFLSALALLLMLFNRIMLLRMFQYPVVWAWIQWFGVLWFQVLGLVCMTDRLFKREVQWKNRPL